MKAIFVSLAVLMSLSLASSITPARADADDAAWIKKCVSDNKKKAKLQKWSLRGARA